MASIERVALVLGAVKGIGKGIGLALAEDGCRVAATYYDWEDDIPEMKKDFGRFGPRCLTVKVDLRDTEAVGPMVREVAGHFGRIDILINNIERGGWPVVHGPYQPDQWDLEMATTLRAKQWVFEAALPYLKQSDDGCVINVSSVAGMVGRSGPAGPVFNEGYAAANRGVSLLTETWARLGAPNVRVNEIMLGFFETRHGPGTRGWGLLTDAQKQAIIDHTLLGRIGRIHDVIKTVRYIIKDAPFMTGAVIRLDGGYALGADPLNWGQPLNSLIGDSQ